MSVHIKGNKQMNYDPNDDQPVQSQQYATPFDTPYLAGRLQPAPQSFTTPAVICMVLYCTLWLPGLIANIVYLVEARKARTLTEATPQGYGCLWALLLVAGILPLAIAIVLPIVAFLLPIGK
jgi:hypothetical protein